MSVRSLLALAALCTLSAPALTGCHAVASADEGKTTLSSSDTWLTADQVKAAQIEVGTAAAQPIDTVVTTTGRVTFDDLKVAHVFSPVTGRVATMNAGLGQRLKRGDALATIVSPDVGQWSSDLGKANADFIAAEHDFQRKTELLAVKAVAKADYEASEDAYRQAKAERDRAEQKARMLRGGITDTVSQGYTLTTPIDGEVIARMVNPGVEVSGQYSNGTTSELFTVGELDKVWVLADVYEADLARVAIGAKVTVNVLAYPGRVFEGTVDWVAGALDPATRTAKVRCTFANPDRALKPEMYANVHIVASEARQALSVPRSAVVKLGEQSVVFAQVESAADGRVRFERMPVAVDEAIDGAYVPVEHGIEPGVRVVTHGAQAISAAM
jgi:cobalt-zinc-cadmium efflux system membrane fusion protein